MARTVGDFIIERLPASHVRRIDGDRGDGSLIVDTARQRLSAVIAGHHDT